VRSGSKGDPGILPRFMEDIFCSENSMEKTSVSCYMLELYRVTPEVVLVRVKWACRVIWLIC